MFERTAHIIAALVAALAIQSTTTAEDARPESPAARSVISSSFGVQDDAGALIAGGPSYKARFGVDAFEFTPALPGAPRNLPLTFRLESIERGDLPVAAHAWAGVQPTRDDDAVVYSRGVSIAERYEARRDGVELSFEFAERPAGAGDLVVRMRLETDLPLASQSARGGLRFELDGVGGVLVGAATGIDARGRCVDGAVRLDGTLLELSLPAAFVDAAVYPLVLDPLIGGVFTVASDWDESDPDIAYDHSNDVYLVVWERAFSATDYDIRGQRVSPVGALVGGLLTIESSPLANGFNPSVANLNQVDMFSVAYEENGDIFARAVNASTGALGTTVTVASGVDQQIAPDLGGDSNLLDSDAVAVWWNATTANIEAAQLQTFSDGTTQVIGKTAFSTGNNDQWPTISKSGGPTSRYLITWKRDFAPNPSGIRGKIVDKDLNVLVSLITIANTTAWESLPDNDGDGTDFLVAYQTEAALFSFDNDIACRTVSFDPVLGTASVGPEVTVEGDGADDEIRPAVSFLGSTFLIGYSDHVVGTEYDLYVRSVDPFTGLPCEGEFSVELSVDDSDFMAIASRWSGDSFTTNEQALLVWEDRNTGTGDGDISGQSFIAADGLTADLGGGCGLGGTASATCARVGNASFTHRVRGANPLWPAYLILSADRVSAICGPCVLEPNPYTGFVFDAGLTDLHGNAAIVTPIPSLAVLEGLTFFEQWFIGSATPSCGAFGGDLSNALAIEIE